TFTVYMRPRPDRSLHFPYTTLFRSRPTETPGRWGAALALVVQLAETLGLGPRCWGFESLRAYNHGGRSSICLGQTRVIAWVGTTLVRQVVCKTIATAWQARFLPLPLATHHANRVTYGSG